MTDCTKQNAQMQVHLTGWMQVWQDQQTGIGGILCNSATLSCTTLSLKATIRIPRTIPVSLTGAVDLPFCFTNLAACALDQGDGEAKGEEESSDPEFPPPHLLEETTLVEMVGGKCSFTSSTEVSTDHGKQAIGTLQVGERALAYNPKTGKMESEPILHVWINHDHDLVDLTVTTTTKGEHGKAATKTSEVVHTNQKHPFFTLEHGFLPVGQITLGMHLLRADGRVGVVTGWKVVPGTRVMYNLEVAQDHTFTVGVGQWVVHNCASGHSQPTRRQMFNQAKRDAGIPISSSPVRQGWVNIYSDEPQRVY
jgi:Pretoxin HINT domain